MQFKLVLIGTLFLSAGLMSYAWIPNIHTTTIFQTLPLPSPANPVQLPAGATLELPQNLTVVSGHNNTLLVNLTVLSASGQLSSVFFGVFKGNQTRSCGEILESSYLLNQEVSNGTVETQIEQSGQYCFVIDNGRSMAAKTVTLTTSINSTYTQVQIANDGAMNLLGLFAGGLGFLILVAGILKKTVIPWE